MQCASVSLRKGRKWVEIKKLERGEKKLATYRVLAFIDRLVFVGGWGSRKIIMQEREGRIFSKITNSLFFLALCENLFSDS